MSAAGRMIETFNDLLVILKQYGVDFVLKSTQKAPENALIRKVNGKVWSVCMIYSFIYFVFLY